MNPRSPPLPAGLLRVAACVVLIGVAAGSVYWPGLAGYWGRDDFMQLAIVQLVGSPWPFFFQDHYPVPGAVFRPLGFASMWLDTALFGTAYRGHALVDLGLHVGVALALFALLRRLRVPVAIGLGAALLFALHPLAIGTAQWWSARFDLLATGFILLVLLGACRWRERPSLPLLAATLLAALAAMASKEIGLLVVVPISLAWWPHPGVAPARRAQAWRAIGAAWAIAGLFLAWRALVLGTPASALTGHLVLSDVLTRGLADWLHYTPGYLSFWQRLDGAGQACLVLAGLAALALVLPALRAGPHADAGAPRLALRLGLCLLLLPALLQAPIAAQNALPLTGEMSAVGAAMQSRLYYLGVAGVVILLAALLSRAHAGLPRRWRAVVLLPALLALAAWAPAAREASTQFAAVARANGALAQAAVAAVADLDLPDSACRIVFDGIAPPPEWDIFVSMDSVLKALALAQPGVGHCIVRANYPTWFGLFAAPWQPADALPFVPLMADGEAVPWLHAGGLVIAYLEPPSDPAGDALADGWLLEWRSGQFVATRTGRLPMR